jgi:putative ABC transport system ATP-binding protein
MEAIQLEHVSKVYHIGAVETQALNDVSLSIAEGEFTALVGPSGSGKTTLLQLIGCLDKPDRGAVNFQGQDVTRLSANQRADLRRDRIGFIFQFFALVPVLTAYENVELPLLLSGIKPKERRARVIELLEAVGVANRADHRPNQMSGGQQQRVAIARALAPRPVLVLADEPTANLDDAHAARALELLRTQALANGAMLVVASHDARVHPLLPRVYALPLRPEAVAARGVAA